MKTKKPIVVLSLCMLTLYACTVNEALNDDAASRRDAGAAELFSILLKHKADIARVTLWGVYDKTSWLNNRPVRGRTSYPLLFDRNYQPKAALGAVIKTAQLETK